MLSKKKQTESYRFSLSSYHDDSVHEKGNSLGQDSWGPGTLGWRGGSVLRRLLGRTSPPLCRHFCFEREPALPGLQRKHSPTCPQTLVPGTAGESLRVWHHCSVLVFWRGAAVHVWPPRLLSLGCPRLRSQTVNLLPPVQLPLYRFPSRDKSVSQIQGGSEGGSPMSPSGLSHFLRFDFTGSKTDHWNLVSADILIPVLLLWEPTEGRVFNWPSRTWRWLLSRAGKPNGHCRRQSTRLKVSRVYF